MPATPTLLLRDVKRSFGSKEVLRGLSFEVQQGEVFGLLGPNGAGKTTALRMATGILLPDSGVVEVLGQDPLGRVRNEVGYLPEERGLYPQRPLLPALIYLGELSGLHPHESKMRALSLLSLLHLETETQTLVKNLSGGMVQKAPTPATSPILVYRIAKMNRFILLGVSLVGVLLLTACGGGSPSSEGQVHPPTLPSVGEPGGQMEGGC
nr:ATP-binding cassette domain-containing protein [bacterium]